MIHWCVLRCSGRSTLQLARSLAADGFEVWTPVMVRRVRVPRMNARRIVEEALIGGFVFADHGQRADLLDLSETGRHAKFRFLREADGEISKIHDRELDGLRWVEARANVSAKKTDRTIPAGVTVRVGSGLFSGMTGVVRRSKRGVTLVCFNDRYSAEIPTSLLNTDAAYSIHAALAA